MKKVKRIRKIQAVKPLIKQEKPEIKAINFKRLYGICIYNDNVYVIENNNLHTAKLKNVSTDEIINVPANKITSLPNNSFLYKTYEFLYYRKWYITNYYNESYKREVLYELNLYLKQTEKFLIKKYNK